MISQEYLAADPNIIRSIYPPKPKQTSTRQAAKEWANKDIWNFISYGLNIFPNTSCFVEKVWTLHSPIGWRKNNIASQETPRAYTGQYWMLDFDIINSHYHFTIVERTSTFWENWLHYGSGKQNIHNPGLHYTCIDASFKSCMQSQIWTKLYSFSNIKLWLSNFHCLWNNVNSTLKRETWR